MISRRSHSARVVADQTSQSGELARVLDAYLASVEAGHPLDPDSLARDHPEIADRLRACLSVLELAGHVEETADPAGPAEVGTERVLGDFRIIRPIGRGGMGMVFEAEQVTLRRRVALKVLPFSAALDPQTLRRFEIEAQAAAQLHHTSIVPIFAVGCERDVHYYAMQYIEGRSLAAMINELREGETRHEDTPAETNPSRPRGEGGPEGRMRGRSASANGFAPDQAHFRRAATLGVQAAEALHHAHQKGVIHRDVKPANLLVDVAGNLWVTDFGLARMDADSSLTLSGDVLGTIRYMSPEQSSAERDKVDHRTDIYSLGATLYELLTLHHSADGTDRQEILRRKCLDEPRSLRSWCHAIPRDLETIVLKALSREPDHRYSSAQAMADDLRRFLDHRPVLARRPSLLRRGEKWVRRHKALAALASACILFALVSLAILGALHRSNRRIEARAHQDQYVRDLRQANFLTRQGHYTEAIRILSLHQHDPAEDDRTFPWFYLWRLCHTGPRSLLGHKRDVYHIEYSPDGRLLASAGMDGTVRLWDMPSGQLIRTLEGHVGDVDWVTFSPDGRRLASSGNDGTVRLWSVEGEANSTVVGKHDQECVAVLFTRDGRRLFSGDASGILKVWDVQALKLLDSRKIQSGRIESMALSADGTRLVIGGKVKSLKILDARTLAEGPAIAAPEDTNAVAIAPDGKSVVGVNGYRIDSWDAATGKPIAGMGLCCRVQGASFAPDGGTLAVCTGFGIIQLYETRAWTPVKSLRRLDQPLWGLAFAPDGRTLASCSGDGTIDLWDVTTVQDRAAIRLPVLATALFSWAGPGEPVGAFGASVAGGGSSVLGWDPFRGELAYQTHLEPLRATQFVGASENLGRIAVIDLEGRVTAWEMVDGSFCNRIELEHVASVFPSVDPHDLEVVVSPNGDFLARYIPGRGTHVWNLATGEERCSPPFYAGWPLVFAPVGTLIAEHAGQRLAIWDFSSGRLVVSRGALPSPVSCLAYSKDGRKLAVGLQDGSVEIWKARTLELEAGFSCYDHPVMTLAFSHDGKVLVSASQLGAIHFWDMATYLECGSLVGHTGPVLRVAFSADGSSLLSIGGAPGGSELIVWPGLSPRRP